MCVYLDQISTAGLIVVTIEEMIYLMHICAEKLLSAQPCIEHDGVAAVAVGDYIRLNRSGEIQTKGLDIIINHRNHFLSYGPSCALQNRCPPV